MESNKRFLWRENQAITKRFVGIFEWTAVCCLNFGRASARRRFDMKQDSHNQNKMKPRIRAQLQVSVVTGKILNYAINRSSNY